MTPYHFHSGYPGKRRSMVTTPATVLREVVEEQRSVWDENSLSPSDYISDADIVPLCISPSVRPSSPNSSKSEDGWATVEYSSSGDIVQYILAAGTVKTLMIVLK